MSPYVSAVIVDENCDVTQYSNLPLRTISAKCAPLFMEKELDHLFDGKLTTMRVEGCRYCFIFSMRILGRPLVPTHIPKPAAQHAKQRIIGKPRDISFGKLLESRPRLVGGVIEEIGGRLLN